MSSKRSVIQSNKSILSGQPVFRDTRVPIHTLMDYLDAGDNLNDFLHDFPTVTKQQALAVLKLAKENLLN